MQPSTTTGSTFASSSSPWLEKVVTRLPVNRGMRAQVRPLLHANEHWNTHACAPGCAATLACRYACRLCFLCYSLYLTALVDLEASSLCSLSCTVLTLGVVSVRLRRRRFSFTGHEHAWQRGGITVVGQRRVALLPLLKSAPVCHLGESSSMSCPCCPRSYRFSGSLLNGRPLPLCVLLLFLQHQLHSQVFSRPPRLPQHTRISTLLRTLRPRGIDSC